MFSPSTVTYTFPLPANASPTALSPGYIVDFDQEEDEEDHADHPVDGGDNDDNESSDDDDDDDDVVKDEEDEERRSISYSFRTTLSVVTFAVILVSLYDVVSTLHDMLESGQLLSGMFVEENCAVKFQKRVDVINGGVRASKTKTMQDAIEFVTKLMDKKISTPAERQAENKRKLDNTSKNNQNQQQPNKRQNTGRAYIAGH
ncbi:hypothetical protein Tco_0787574 [Tanacetum coccineum]